MRMLLDEILFDSHYFNNIILDFQRLFLAISWFNEIIKDRQLSYENIKKVSKKWKTAFVIVL